MSDVDADERRADDPRRATSDCRNGVARPISSASAWQSLLTIVSFFIARHARWSGRRASRSR